MSALASRSRQKNRRGVKYQFYYDPAQAVTNKDDGSFAVLSSSLVDDRPEEALCKLWNRRGRCLIPHARVVAVGHDPSSGHLRRKEVPQPHPITRSPRGKRVAIETMDGNKTEKRTLLQHFGTRKRKLRSTDGWVSFTRLHPDHHWSRGR